MPQFGKQCREKKHAKFALRHVPCVGHSRGWWEGSRPGSRQPGGVHQVAARDSYACPAKCAAYFSQSLRGMAWGRRGRCPCQFWGVCFFNAFCCHVLQNTFKRMFWIFPQYFAVLQLTLAWFFLFLYIVFSTTFFFHIFLEWEVAAGGRRGGKAVRGILSKLTQLIYMFPTVRSSLHQHSFIYESMSVCASVCLCVHGFFAQFFVAALQFENILPGGYFSSMTFFASN